MNIISRHRNLALIKKGYNTVKIKSTGPQNAIKRFQYKVLVPFTVPLIKINRGIEELFF